MTVTCSLPPAYLARDVIVSIEKCGSRWQAVGVDAVGNAYPLALDGYTGSPKCATKSGAQAMLESHGAREGDRIFAEPARAVRS